MTELEAARLLAATINQIQDHGHEVAAALEVIWVGDTALEEPSIGDDPWRVDL
jgi:hypothetical protein